jgi:hypothetical protein
MFKAKDGKPFGNRFAQRKYDSSHGDAAPDKKAAAPKMNAVHEAKETPEFEAGEQEGAQEQNQEENEAPAQVVAKHGKAVHVHTSHDHTNNKHRVHSVHPDGHQHDSEHASAQEAQQAANELGSEGGEQAAAQSDQGEESAGPEADGFHMPRLA